MLRDHYGVITVPGPGDEGCGTVLHSRAQPSTTKLHGKEELRLGGGIELVTREEREGGKQFLIEIFVSGEEVRRLTCAEAVGQFWAVAMAEKDILYLSIIDGRKRFEDGLNFADSVVDDIPCERNVPNGRAE